MDLIIDDTFLGEVSFDGNEIIDVFNCECQKVFTVTADYDGTPGSFYGQIDIRNGQQKMVKIADSCVLELPLWMAKQNSSFQDWTTLLLINWLQNYAYIASADHDCKLTSSIEKQSLLVMFLHLCLAYLKDF